MDNVGYPHCPICGAECEKIYRDRSFVVVGCDECITSIDAWDEDECFPEKEMHIPV